MKNVRYASGVHGLGAVLSCLSVLLFCRYVLEEEEVGPAERVSRLSLHPRFPGLVQTCRECGLNCFKMFPEKNPVGL